MYDCCECIMNISMIESTELNVNSLALCKRIEWLCSILFIYLFIYIFFAIDEHMKIKS